MLYIGTSLGRCLLSLMRGEVSEDEVMFIVTRTDCPDYERYINVVDAYHAQGNPYASDPSQYELNDYPLEKVRDLAALLWHSGKIHQPRTFVGNVGGRPYRHPVGYRNGIWMQVVPTNQNTNPSVVEAWEKYKMLDELTK